MDFSLHRSIPVVDLEMPLALVGAKVIRPVRVRILAAVDAGKRGQDEMPDPQEKARGGGHDATPAKKLSLWLLSSAGVPQARFAERCEIAVREISLCFKRLIGRGGEIRTPDPLVPNQMRYQTALRPDGLCRVISSLFKPR
jgi:hypothetical protein